MRRPLWRLRSATALRRPTGRRTTLPQRPLQAHRRQAAPLVSQAMRAHSHRRRGSGCHRPTVPRPTRHLTTVEECKSVIQLGQSCSTGHGDGVGTSVDHPRPIGPRHGSVPGTRWTEARLLNHRLRGVNVSRGTSLHTRHCSRPHGAIVDSLRRVPGGARGVAAGTACCGGCCGGVRRESFGSLVVGD